MGALCQHNCCELSDRGAFHFVPMFAQALRSGCLGSLGGVHGRLVDALDAEPCLCESLVAGTQGSSGISDVDGGRYGACYIGEPCIRG